MRALFGMAAVASLAAGCDTPSDYQPLDPENQAKVDTIIEDALAGEEVVLSLIRDAKPLFSASGDEGDNEQLATDVKTDLETLKYYRDHDMIYQYDSRVMEITHDDSDAIAYHHSDRLKRKALDDNYIVLDVADRDSWTPAILPHEIGHIYGHHSDAVSKAVDADLPWSDFLKIVLQEKDYSYLVSELNVVTDTIFFAHHFQVDSLASYIKAEIDAGKVDSSEAEELMRSTLNIDYAEWLEEQAEVIFVDHATEFAQLGITQDELVKALQSEKLQERLQEITQEGKQEIKEAIREIKHELRAEMQRDAHFDVPKRAKRPY